MPLFCRPVSSVGIATGYGLDGPGSNLGGGEIFRTCPDRPWGPPSLLYTAFRVFRGGKELPGRDADPSPPSGAVVMNGLYRTSVPVQGCTLPFFMRIFYMQLCVQDFFTLYRYIMQAT
jgi:hypothetical protein